MQTNAVPLQLAVLSLAENLLEGTLPESWSACSSVSLSLETLYVAMLESCDALGKTRY